MKKSRTTNAVRRAAADSVLQQFESLVALRNVSKEVFNLDEASFVAHLTHNLLRFMTSIGDITFNRPGSEETLNQMMDLLEMSLQKNLKRKSDEFQKGVQQAIDQTDDFTSVLDNLSPTDIEKLREALGHGCGN